MIDLSLLTAYQPEEEKELPEVKGKGYVLRHKKTGARVMLIDNDDDNKVFTIGFRTPPADDTGVPHITEHSVLCGSKAFPVKDPFVELAKGSLNTFLNAMTYPDKTVYPVASQNDKDFHNLMHVYLDAVFYPNIYEKTEIMQQEGWHYETDENGDLFYNGVVYNEMRGSYSSPDNQLFRLIQESLLPDSCYACDSGGDPECIPTLTQEAFLDFHRKYYHPSNSYIYLYGNVDFEKELAFIDSEYLSAFDHLNVDSEIGLVPGFDAPARLEDFYSLAEGDDEADNTYLSYNVIVGTSLDKNLMMAFTVLSQVLLEMPGAPLEKALIDAGIGKNVYSSFEDSIKQPMFSVIAQNANAEDEERFAGVVEDTLQSLAEGGLSKRALMATINRMEFKHKEKNFGRYPKGLMYGLDAFNTWLYDDAHALDLFSMNEVFDFLKEKVETDYFENLIRKYILDNDHKSYVVLKPKRGLNKIADANMKEELAAYKHTLSEEELLRIGKNAEHLKEYQSEPDAPEALLTIPLLSIDDIDKQARKLNNQVSEIEQVKVVSHDIFTNGISYVSFNFDLKDIDWHDYAYISLITDVLRYVDTEHYSYNELNSEIDYYTGGIGFSTIVTDKPDGKDYVFNFIASFRVLHEYVDKAFELMEEILFTSKITDKKRLKEIIAEAREDLKSSISSAGHTTAMGRALSYIAESGAVRELTEGIEYYNFLADLDDHFEERYDTLCTELEKAIGEILRRGSLTVNYTDDAEPSVYIEKGITELSKKLSTRLSFDKEADIPVEKKNEGFKTASKVQYVATAGNYREAGLDFTGNLDVLQTIFAYDYLWINVRVKGGAYGCMCGFPRSGKAYFTSYRDPNLTETYEIYKKAYDYVKNFAADDRDMTKYIIGAIAKLDAPLTPSAEGSFSFAAYELGVTEEDLQRERDEVLSTSVDDIRKLAPYIEATLAPGTLCVIGDESKIAEAKDAFDTIREIK